MTTPTHEFFATLYDTFEDGWITLFTIDGNGERRTLWYDVHEHAQCAADALRLNANVWFGVATRAEQLDEGRRGGAADCAHLPAMFADIDIAGPNHKDSTGLPANVDEAFELIDRFPLRPSIVVHSGGGLHPYWLFDEPCEHDDAAMLLERWAETWQQIATKMRLKVDNVFDLPRVLRVPGTTNHKNGADVKLLDLRHIRYGISEFIDATVAPPQRQQRSKITSMPVIGTRPGDVFNQRHDAGYVLALDGWKHSNTERNGNETWLHPWGPTSDCSATVYADDGHTTIWSETVPRHRPTIETKRPYDPFGLYVHLIYGGDFEAAAKQLVRDGYGERIDITVVTMPNGKCRPKRKIRTGSRQLDDLANEVVDGLVELNDPPRMFSYGDTVTRWERDELHPVDRVALTHIVESSLQPIKLNKEGEEIPTRVDATALDLVLYRLLHDLPKVEGVARSPFLRADGTVCTDRGWDETSQMFLASTCAVDVPDTPTDQDLERSVELIDEMIGDFPLSTDADRAHVFALLLTMVTRHLVPLSPLFALDGNGPGVGKNLLSECCAYVGIGEWAQTDPLPLDGEEQRKQITAMLSTGRSVAIFDEAHIITGTSLARLITSTTWGDRLLGYSKQVSYPNKITVVALGNNVEVQGDMPRRTILIRLSSSEARPELRSGFRHDDLRAWVEVNRPALLSATLTILRAWVVAGRPPGMQRLGSFDQWSQMIGGALAHAGVDGFLSNVDEMRSRGATDDSDMTDHLAELHSHFGTFSFSTAEVAEMLGARRLEVWPPKVGTDDRKMAAQLGYAYRRASERWFGDLMLSSAGRGHNNVKRWQLVEKPEKPQECGGDGGHGGDATPYAGEKSRDEKNISGGREVSPPSPPSPPLGDATESDGGFSSQDHPESDPDDFLF